MYVDTRMVSSCLCCRPTHAALKAVDGFSENFVRIEQRHRESCRLPGCHSLRPAASTSDEQYTVFMNDIPLRTYADF